MFKTSFVNLVVTILLSPIILLERFLVSVGKGPNDFERKRFIAIEKAIQ